jgi:hypothetical protein
MRKPNYQFDRAERKRSKDNKKAEKLAAQAARREAASSAPAEEDAATLTEPNEDQDGSERAGEKEVERL